MAEFFADNEESSGAEWILMRHANREIVKPSDTLFPTVAGNLTDSQVESFFNYCWVLRLESLISLSMPAHFALSVFLLVAPKLARADLA